MFDIFNLFMKEGYITNSIPSCNISSPAVPWSRLEMCPSGVTCTKYNIKEAPTKKWDFIDL